jgi:CHAT domain-containing protein/tetratricopeptide (TPR) repeat protein
MIRNMKHLFTLGFLVLFFPYFLIAQASTSIEELNQRAEEERLAGKFDLALISIQDAIVQLGDRRDSLYASCQNDRGLILWELGKYEAAEAALKESAAIREKLFGKNNAEYSECLNNLGLLYVDLGRNEEAEQYLKENLRIKKEVLGTNHTDYALALNNLAYYYDLVAEYEKAEQLYIASCNSFEEIYGKEDINYANSLHNLATLYISLGRNEEAEFMLQDAARIIDEKYGKEHPDYLTAIEVLGNLYNQTSRNAEALPLLLQAAASRKKSLGTTHPDYINSITTIGIYHQSIEEYQEALNYFKQSKELIEDLVGKQHPAYFRSLLREAEATSFLNNFEEAEGGFQEAKQLAQQLFEEYSPDYHSLLNTIAFHYQQKKEFEQAEKLLLKAQSIADSIYSEHHPNRINGLLHLAIFYSEHLPNAEKAASYFKALFEVNLKTAISVDIEQLDNIPLDQFYYNQSALLSFTRLSNYFKVRYQNTSNPKYLNLRQKALQKGLAFNDYIRNSYNSKDDKLAALKNNKILIDAALNLALQQANKTNQEVDYELCFNNMEQNKSMLLNDVIKSNRALEMGALPKEVSEERQLLQDSLLKVKKDFAEATKEEELEAVRIRENQLNIKISQLQEKIKTDYPDYYRLNFDQISVTAKDIQSTLAEQEALIEYYIADTVLYGLFVSPKEIKLKTVAIEKEALYAKVSVLRNSLTAYNEIATDAEKVFKNYTQTAYWFYQNLLADFLTANTELEHLIIVADGELGHLPFESFLSEEVKEKHLNYKNLNYLIKKYSISYSYSANLFIESLQPKPKTNNRQILGIAASYAGDSLSGTRSPYLRNLRRVLSPLPAAREEINALAEHFQGSFLLGDAASEGVFKAKAKEYAVLHLAMHGLLNKQSPLLSSLAFTENGDTTEDNFLQAWEISKLKLNADLVILSACETGYGRFQEGEGVLSLARSFMYAGVPSMVVSLWEVNDASTAIIMQSFYQNLSKGLSKAEALRQAKLAYLNSADSTAAHPAFWSAFIQIGNHRAIDLGEKSKMSWTWILLGVGLLGVGGLAVARFRRRAKQERPSS